jgi:hypothetical protein
MRIPSKKEKKEKFVKSQSYLINYGDDEINDREKIISITAEIIDLYDFGKFHVAMYPTFVGYDNHVYTVNTYPTNVSDFIKLINNDTENDYYLYSVQPYNKPFINKDDDVITCRIRYKKTPKVIEKKSEPNVKNAKTDILLAVYLNIGNMPNEEVDNYCIKAVERLVKETDTLNLQYFLTPVRTQNTKIEIIYPLPTVINDKETNQLSEEKANELKQIIKGYHNNIFKKDDLNGFESKDAYDFILDITKYIRAKYENTYTVSPVMVDPDTFGSMVTIMEKTDAGVQRRFDLIIKDRGEQIKKS